MIADGSKKLKQFPNWAFGIIDLHCKFKEVKKMLDKSLENRSDKVMEAGKGA